MPMPLGIGSTLGSIVNVVTTVTQPTTNQPSSGSTSTGSTSSGSTSSNPNTTPSAPTSSTNTNPTTSDPITSSPTPSTNHQNTSTEDELDLNSSPSTNNDDWSSNTEPAIPQNNATPPTESNDTGPPEQANEQANEQNNEQNNEPAPANAHSPTSSNELPDEEPDPSNPSSSQAFDNAAQSENVGPTYIATDSPQNETSGSDTNISTASEEVQLSSPDQPSTTSANNSSQNQSIDSNNKLKDPRPTRTKEQNATRETKAASVKAEKSTLYETQLDVSSLVTAIENAIQQGGDIQTVIESFLSQSNVSTSFASSSNTSTNIRPSRSLELSTKQPTRISIEVSPGIRQSTSNPTTIGSQNTRNNRSIDLDYHLGWIQSMQNLDLFYRDDTIPSKNTEKQNAVNILA